MFNPGLRSDPVRPWMDGLPHRSHRVAGIGIQGDNWLALLKSAIDNQTEVTAETS